MTDKKKHPYVNRMEPHKALEIIAALGLFSRA